MENFQLDFLGIGTIKSGTSLLADLMIQHPEIQWASQKEVNYFNTIQADGSTNPYHEQPFSFYRQFFPDQREAGRKWGEFSPVYISDPEGMKKIHALFPALQIIVSLRHPIQRAWSHYLYARDFLQIIPREVGFTAALNRFPWLLSLSLYSGQLKNLFTLFPRDQCLVLIFEEFIRDPGQAISGVYRHIGVDASFCPVVKKVNARKQIRFQFIENIINSVSRLKSKVGENAMEDIYNSPLYPMFLKIKHRIRDNNVKPGAQEVLSPETFNGLIPLFREDMEQTLSLLNRNTAVWPAT